MDFSLLIPKLVQAGRAGDLYAILIGASPYSVPESESGRDESGDVTNADDYQTLFRNHQLWTLASHHLAFVAKYGERESGVWDGGKYLSPFPIEFGQWVENGCPGLCEASLLRYLAVHPLSE
jgi:hypothetical protein